jgi:septation ring formation regulator EzrA
VFAQSLPLILTLLAIGAGMFLNNKGLSDLRADMKDMKAELKSEISATRLELKEDIAGAENRIGARIDRLENRLDTRLNAIDSELIRFSELKGHLEGRIDEIARIAKLTSERVTA